MDLYLIISLSLFTVAIITYSNLLLIIELPDYSLDVSLRSDINFKVIINSILMSTLVIIFIYLLSSRVEWYYLIFIIALTSMSLCDVKYKLVPDRFTSILFFVAFFCLTIEPEVGIVLNKLFTMAGIIGTYLIIRYFYEEIFGFADILAYAMIGLLLGIEGLTVVFIISVFTGFAFGIIKYLINRDNSIAFIPFINIGLIITLLTKDYDLLKYMFGGY